MKIQNSYQDNPFGQLYLVPTPIGNLEDMTYRAVKILKQVDVILAEDTRNSIKLLNHYQIKKPMQSYHEYSSQQDQDRVIYQLRQGTNMALISDAGMPLINDPGNNLVKEAISLGIRVIPLPGANAAVTALVASGLTSDYFKYYGFFPRNSKDQVDVLEEVCKSEETAIFYESPYRLKDTLKQIVKVIGGDVPVVLAREISKKFEQFLRGNSQEILLHLHENEIKGECVLIIEGGWKTKERVDETERLSYKEQVEMMMAFQGIQAKEAIKEVAKLRQVKKQEVYQAYHEID